MNKFSDWLNESLNKDRQTISASKLISWVKENHYKPEDFEEIKLIERIKKYPFYELKMLNIDNLESKEDTEASRIKKYSGMMNKSDYPPIICYPNGKNVLDGNHRLEALREMGDKLIKAWVGTKRAQKGRTS